MVSLTMASIARAGEALFSVVLYRPHVERMTDTRWPDYVRIYRRSSVITAAACGPSLILMMAYNWSPSVPIQLVALAVGTGIILWLVALKLLDHPLSEEIGRFISKGRQAVGLVDNT